MSMKVAQDSIGTGIRYQLGTNDNLLVTTSATVVSTNSAAIRGSGNSQNVRVYGVVGAATYGVELDSGTTSDVTQYRVFVGNQAVIDAETAAISLNGFANRIDNYGSLNGNRGLGIQLSAEGTGHTATINNFGTINGDTAGIICAFGDIYLTNRGVITSQLNAIITGSAADTIYNRGTIDGDVSLGFGDDRLVNRGFITGQIVLSDGADMIDNIGGTVDGDITFGAGADTFMPGASAETAHGGGDGDTLDFTRSSGVHLALDGSLEATGWAKDDTYDGFANITGSNLGADILIGDSGDNTLNGGGGADTLRGGLGRDTLGGGLGNDTLDAGAGADTLIGGSGNDILTGGAGRDRMTGGSGADTFVFGPADFSGSTASAADVINDFSAPSGDRIDLKAVDANASLASDQAFTFIGTAAFHRTAGELRYEAATDGVLVQGDVNGDGTADFGIYVARIPSLFAGDFVL